MTVTDPFFPSLWDAALSELCNETPVWEVFVDAENLLSGARPALQADLAEDTLRRLRDEGWATISRRALDAPPDSTPTPLSDDEIAEAVGRARAWFLAERAPGRTVPTDLLPIFLEPSAQWLDWDAARWQGTIYPYILRLEGAEVGRGGVSQDDIGIYESDVRFQAPPIGLRVPHDDGELIVIDLDVGAVPDRTTGALIVRPAD